MSWMSRKGQAQYNYHPERTRPGGPLEVRCPDSKRPDYQPARPGQKDRRAVKRPGR